MLGTDRRCSVGISYNKLWKLMIDHNMNKTQLRKEAGLSTNVVAKLSKNDSVSMDTLLRICKVLHCDVGDIVEVTDNTKTGEKLQKESL
jgi:DNA (cytosine-5)-methyltransferase 1